MSGTADEMFGTTRSADATERFLIAVPEDSKGKTGMTICAEPSPDALAALGASLAASAAVPEQVSATLASSFSESAASIGLRTQTIQLLRDAMYRLCEGYAGDALSEEQFQLLHSQYQGVMLGLLAIEQLTGAVVARPAIVHVSGSSSAGSQLAITQREIDVARDRLVEVEKGLPATRKAQEDAAGALTTAREAMSADCRDVDPNDVPADKQACKTEAAFETYHTKFNESAAKAAEYQAASDKVAENKDLIARLEQNRDSQTSGSAITTGGGQIISVPPSGTINQHTAQHISGAVKDIVAKVLDEDYTSDQCFILQVGLVKKLKKFGELKDETERAYARFALESVLQSCVEKLRDEPTKRALREQLRTLRAMPLAAPAKQ